MKTLILALGIAMAMPISVHAQSISPRAQAERFLEQGRMELKRGRTPNAEMAYRKALLVDPSDPMAHYLLANLLARSDRHVDAIGEYKMSLRFDPYGSVSGYCRQALAAYRQTTFAENAATAYVPQLAHPLLQYVPQDKYGVVVPQNGPQYAPQPPPPSSLSTAFDEIDRQAQSEKIKDMQLGVNLSNNAMKSGQWKARDIQLTADHDIANVYSSLAGANTRKGRILDRAAMDAEAQRIRSDADRRVQIEQEQAKERADSHSAWVMERQQDIDNVAGNLKEQLTERPSKFGFDLSAEGTGLYVRNYKSSVPQKRLPDPRFSVLRLTEPGIHDDDSGLK